MGHQSSCCFSYGLGTLGQPCCLRIHSCEGIDVPTINTGGNTGIAHHCPKNVEEAHKLWAESYNQKEHLRNGNLYITN